ncbi:protein PFC0760c-like [Macrobrachium nipponense]|uniref:protein PFC0760c-like n=1 Tax=Macrobrachium nipponense TaxID=159736 RepID=UPI0030C7A9D5
MLWEALPGMIDAKDYETALENIAVAMSLGCLYPWVSVDLARVKGNILCTLGKLEEACECFLSVLAVDEDQEDCRLRLGLCFLLLGRHTDAITEFAKLEEDEKGEYLVSLAEDLEKMQQYGCPYKVLGIKTDVAQDEIRNAYRRSALKYHPDKNDEADKDKMHLLMLQINCANDLLSNKKERKKYDNTRQAVEEYAAEVFKNPNLPEWLDDDEDDESESDCDFEYNSDSDDESESDSEDDSDDESESDSEDDSDDEANLTLMECSHSDHLDNESSVGQLEEEDDDSYEELDDEEDEDEDDAREDIPNEEWLEESDEEDDEFDADDEDDEDDDGWEDIPNEGCLEESSEEGDEIDSTSGEESQDECDSDSVEESDDDSDDE